MSAIVITALAESIFPLASVTVNVALLGPISAQVNAVLLELNVNVAQLSVEPLFIAAAGTITLPVPSKYAVMF